MTIEIEGTRTSDEAWRQARAVPVRQLWEETNQKVAWRSEDDSAAEQIARRLHAIDTTQKELFEKCLKVSRLATSWLNQSNLRGEVLLVRLRCLRGIFNLLIRQQGEVQTIEVREELIDDLLQSGSRGAEESLIRLFEANFGRLTVQRAS